MGKSSYNRRQKKGRATLTLLNLISLFLFFNVSNNYLSCTNTLIIVFMDYMHLLDVGLRKFISYMFGLHYS